MEKILNCQGGQFFPEIYESGLLADFCDACNLNPHVVTAFGGHVGTFADRTVLGLPICCLEEGCFWPFSVHLKGWCATADGIHWHTIPATDGDDKRGGIGTWGRLFSGCRRVNIFCSLHDAMDAETLAHDEGVFCFLRQPDVCDFPFLTALDGMTCRIIFPPFRGNLGWARSWGRFLHEVCETRVIPLPRATLSETIEKRGITA